MILADSSIWIDHFRSPNSNLITLLEEERIWCHPAVIGEVACGNLSDRQGKLELLRDLDPAPVATHSEVLKFIEFHRLMGRGVGYIDMQLLASASIQPGLLWTRDRRLKEVAESLRLSY